MNKRSRPAETGTMVLGWREWAALPDLGVRTIKAKLDTGARTSSLHAFRMRRYLSDGVEMVRFEVHPVQRSGASIIQVEAPVIEERSVRNSGGRVEERPVIETMLRLAGMEWPIELTLTRRDEMGFRMLLGRQALRGRVMVDPATSFRGGQEGAAASSRRPRARRSLRPAQEDE